MSAPGTGPEGEQIIPRSDHVGADGEFLPELFVGEDAFRVPAAEPGTGEYSEGPTQGLPETYVVMPPAAPESSGKTARTAIRGGVALGAVALLAGGLWLGAKEFAPHTTTTITVEQADGVLDNISLVDRTEFAEAHGHTTVDMSSSSQTRIIHVPLVNWNVNTPSYAHEHVGGTETGSVDAVLERGNAVTLAAEKDSNGNLYIKATVDVTGLGIQGVNDFWTANGDDQDGFFAKALNTVGMNTGREDRLNSAEAIALNNLEASGAEALGDREIAAAGIAGVIRQGILEPSAQLLQTVGPQGAKLLREMAGQPLYVEFATYPNPETTKPVNAGIARPYVGSNLLQGPTPVASFNKQFSIKPVVGPSTTINFSTETVSPKQTVVSINAARQIGAIMGTVHQSGDWFVVAPPAQPNASASASAGQ